MIVLGTAQLVGSAVRMSPPEGGFGGIKAVRLSNYTGDALVITNISSDSPGQEYLMPFQQAVYHIENVRTPPTVVGVVLGSAFATQSLFVEWSTDPLTDFPGTYPSALTQAGIQGTAASAWDVHELAVPTTATTVSIPANTGRLSMSFVNDGTTDLEWSHVDSGWGTNPHLTSGTGRTLDTTAAVFFRSLGGATAAGSVQYFETHY